MSEDKLLRPRSIRDHLKSFLLALLMVLMPFLLLEGLLRIFDPWGIYFYDDMAIMGNAFELHEQRHFYLPDGVYELSRWTVTIEDGARVLPTPNDEADCRIVLLGDSVTFGYGVSDDKTWSYQLALAFPNVEFVNAGMIAYNSYDVRGTHEVFSDADAYLYTVVHNDWEPNINPADSNEHMNVAATMPYMVRYGSFLLHRQTRLEMTHDFSPEELLVHRYFQRFYDDIEAIMADSRVELLSFEDSLTTLALIGGGYDFYQVTYPDYPINFVDAHLNPEGNQVLAEELMPIMQEIIEKHCNGI